MKIINVLKNLIKKNHMTYSEYAEIFLGLTERDFTEIMLMFPYLEDGVIYAIEEEGNLHIDSTRDDLIANIIYMSVDPQGDYIDDIEVENNQVTIWELLDIEDLEEQRRKVIDLLSNSNLTVIFK